jgi:glutaminase
MFVGAGENMKGAERTAVIVDPDGVVVRRNAHVSEPGPGAEYVVSSMTDAIARAEDFQLKAAVDRY